MYVRQIDDQVLTFRVSGKLWMRSLVMSDLETNTEWAHLLGRAMKGEMQGKVLDPLITDMVTWDTWRREHPETTVLDMPRTSREYTREFYRDPTQFVFGFEANGKAWSLAMNEMSQKRIHPLKIADQSLLATFDPAGAVTHLFEATVDDRKLEFIQVDDTIMKDVQTGSLWKMNTGEAIQGPMKGKLLRQRVGIMSYRKAWQNFHPESRDVKF